MHKLSCDVFSLNVGCDCKHKLKLYFFYAFKYIKQSGFTKSLSLKWVTHSLQTLFIQLMLLTC